MNQVDVLNGFTLMGGEFFEPTEERPIRSEYAAVLDELLPDGWSRERHGVWLGAHRSREEPTPEHGFKIHVSSIPDDAERTLRCVAPECVAADVDFKVAADPLLLTNMNGKRYGRGGSGKFMAIYPRSTEQFVSLLERLDRRTAGRGLRGPYILSDCRYNHNPVLYYRYGGFRSVPRLRADGSTEQVMRSPDGGMIADERLPYFHLPPWVKDPFGAESVQKNQGGMVIHDRYRVEGVFAYSNTGGVYHAIDEQTGDTVVIKEGRPYTGYWPTEDGFIDAPQLLQREYELLTLLNEARVAPRPVELFTEWEHTFLVQELVSGLTYQQYWASGSNILAPFVHREGRIEAFVPKFARLSLNLLDVMRRVHACGVLIGDVSSTNVFVEDIDTLSVRLIDLESAIRPAIDGRYMRFAASWATPGFARPEREATRTLTVEDDLFGVAMLMYGAVAPVQALATLEPDARWAMLDRFVEVGLPAGVVHAIRALAGGDADACAAHLQPLLHYTTT